MGPFLRRRTLEKGFGKEVKTLNSTGRVPSSEVEDRKQRRPRVSLSDGMDGYGVSENGENSF